MARAAGSAWTVPAVVASDLLAQAGLGRLRTLDLLPGGANNQVFRAGAEGGLALLKLYFRHHSDPRDRLAAEYDFTRFAWAHGIRSVPQPLAEDRERGAGLYEFVVGRPLAAADVDEAALQDALRLYRDLNGCRVAPDAAMLPEASEACFSLEEHLACVERRVRRLGGIEPESPLHVAAARLARNDVLPTWVRIGAAARAAAARDGLVLEKPIPLADRRLSPSDFGFHNALRTAAGSLRFLDFEYAGWDDPAKLIGDFFCQPAAPAPTVWYDRFATAVLEEQEDPATHRRRADLLLPVYRVKWCCILLNEFIPVGRDRRRFARRQMSGGGRQAEQLEKARCALRAVQEIEER